jgi:hypothetical protein
VLDSFILRKDIGMKPTPPPGASEPPRPRDKENEQAQSVSAFARLLGRLLAKRIIAADLVESKAPAPKKDQDTAHDWDTANRRSKKE